ncbi:MAG: bifunctional methionine sulfoxide reductase B/A protein [Bacteroidetes bacterium]|nr:bifunctional methionine sulfoxide reductase B/A protein [Bacteroidota bacterium]
MKTDNNDKAKYNELTSQEEYVIINKGTEAPFSGKYYLAKDSGQYICKRCNAPLYASSDKFNSGCGWPSFDDAIPGAVKETPDLDGHRVEITCANCGGHLGHVFKGEGFTDKNTRHCVNSISLNFTPTMNAAKIDTAIFAAGCFWGVEYYLQKADGVITAESGYIGGHVKNPSYKEVCTGRTGHAEAVRVIFDPSKTTYKKLAMLFFETHDPTQANGQGPDLGNQYRSEIFYTNNEQKTIAEELIQTLKIKGLDVVTRVTKASEFYVAEDYHQDYYEGNGHSPYCHKYTKRF